MAGAQPAAGRTAHSATTRATRETSLQGMVVPERGQWSQWPCLTARAPLGRAPGAGHCLKRAPAAPGGCAVSPAAPTYQPWQVGQGATGCWLGLPSSPPASQGRLASCTSIPAPSSQPGVGTRRLRPRSACRSTAGRRHPPGLGEVLGVELPPDAEAQRVQAQALAHGGEELEGARHPAALTLPRDAPCPSTRSQPRGPGGNTAPAVRPPRPPPRPPLTSLRMAGGQLGVARDKKEGK